MGNYCCSPWPVSSDSELCAECGHHFGRAPTKSWLRHKVGQPDMDISRIRGWEAGQATYMQDVKDHYLLFHDCELPPDYFCFLTD